MHEPIFTEYYYKKRDEGKCHRVACNHIAKKRIRIIYKLETENIMFDSTKLKQFGVAILIHIYFWLLNEIDTKQPKILIRTYVFFEKLAFSTPFTCNNLFF